MDNRQPREIKHARRRLMAALKAYFPGECDFPTLEGLMPSVEPEFLKKDLAYLELKGYVQWVNNSVKSLDWLWRKYLLTAEGVEVADQIKADPALEP